MRYAIACSTNLRRLHFIFSSQDAFLSAEHDRRNIKKLLKDSSATWIPLKVADLQAGNAAIADDPDHGNRSGGNRKATRRDWATAHAVPDASIEFWQRSNVHAHTYRETLGRHRPNNSPCRCWSLFHPRVTPIE
ncbi:uncharacterized protein LOC143213713 [Lasioglossum baleicum]|uniref:uncharacterized protein LOC143213713 n=1 Tax=Lasioglossum baleicum TaxID=434251 RepID=UPI003FCD317E